MMNALEKMMRKWSEQYGIAYKDLVFIFKQGFYTGKIAGLRFALQAEKGGDEK